MLRIVLILLAALWGEGLALAQEVQPVPKLAVRVTDLTETLSQDQRSSLEAKLADFERRKGAQIAVLVVPTVKPETIEEFSIRVMEGWKLGRKGVNDGVLLLVAKQDRKLRIEVGYGLEGALSDIVSKRIVSDVIAPHFKAGDFVAGIDAGVDAMLSVIAGEPLPEPTQPDDDIQNIMLFVFGPMVLLLSFAGGFMLRDKFGRLPSAAINAAATGGISSIFFLAAGIGWAAVVTAAIAFAVTWLWRPRGPRSGSSWLPSGASLPDNDWSSRRSRSSSTNDSSGSSDSDFSGGGGESGGGGASGDW